MTREEFTKRLDEFLSHFPNYLDTPEGKEGIRQAQENIIKKYFSMYKYRFKAKDLKTGKWVEGDLIYARQVYPHKPIIIKPMIVEFNIHGGIMWTRKRYFVDESTIELITENK